MWHVLFEFYLQMLWKYVIIIVIIVIVIITTTATVINEMNKTLISC